MTSTVYVVLFQDQHADPWVQVYTNGDQALLIAAEYVRDAGWPGEKLLTLTGLDPLPVGGMLAHASVGDGGWVYVYAVPLQGSPTSGDLEAMFRPPEARERTYGTPRPPGGAS